MLKAHLLQLSLLLDLVVLSYVCLRFIAFVLLSLSYYVHRSDACFARCFTYSDLSYLH